VHGEMSIASPFVMRHEERPTSLFTRLDCLCFLPLCNRAKFRPFWPGSFSVGGPKLWINLPTSLAITSKFKQAFKQVTHTICGSLYVDF